MTLSAAVIRAIREAPLQARVGTVRSFDGVAIIGHGPDARLGEVCEIHPRGGAGSLRGQVIGYRDGHTVIMPFGVPEGLAMDSRIVATGEALSVPVGEAMLGRVLDAFGRPIDGDGDWQVQAHRPVGASPLNPMCRRPVSEPVRTGVNAIDLFLTMGVGQRVGVFAGSGVGKSTLLGMLARNVRADVVVVGLIGERGREVRDFIAQLQDLPTRQRTVVLAATADQPAATRVHAAHAVHAVAEHFRDAGKHVLLILDSMTRFAMAQRELGLAAGEPPTYRGYTPSVFARMPALVERCGAVEGGGAITAVYSVLMEGDDSNDPVVDHMRAILDGHIMLDRERAARGQLPAIDLLRSISRLMPSLADKSHQQAIARVKAWVSAYEASRDLLEMGAYRDGANPALDRAIERLPRLDAMLIQAPDDPIDVAKAHAELLALAEVEA